MSMPEWQRIKEVFAETIDLPQDERIDHLAKLCGGDNLLFYEVRSLLEAAVEERIIIEENAINVPENLGASDADYLERHFGKYRIVREIGSGGMGTVFLAERDDGEFAKQVALKIVRQAVAARDVIDRFKRERQILAGLNHPNIAALYDGGIGEKGEPFLAMEYVDGQTLTEYADEYHLSIDARLSLFIQVCSAVSYAHRNLVVHRDIKPANILVNHDGIPKLLDFGLAKSFASDVQDITQMCAFTPAYASPEQINGGVITTASDVYSLGVIFYELITGSKPLQFDDKSFEEIINTINSSEPPPPSLAANGGVRDRPNRRLRGDLDNIALMALRKEPERRYGSVKEFAADIESHLAGRPIKARPNTFGYLTSKFVRRNKISLAAAGIVVVALLAGISASLWQAKVARRESEKALAVNDSLKKMLSAANPESGTFGKKGAQTSIVDMLNETEKRIDEGELASQPDVRAELRQLMGQGYLAQGNYDAAERNLKLAFAEQSTLYGKDSIGTLVSELDLASIGLARADYTSVLDIFNRRLDQLRRAHVANQVEDKIYFTKIQDYAITCRAVGESAHAEKLLRELVSEAEGRKADPAADSATFLLTLIMLDEGRFEEAKISQMAILSRLQNSVAPDDPAMSQAFTLLGSILMENGEYEQAESNLQKGESIYRKLYGPYSLATFDNIRLQAQALFLKGEYTAANQKINQVLENYQKNSSPKYISYATALTIQGQILNKLGKSGKAEEILREAVRLRTENLPATHFMTALSKGALGEVLLDEGKRDEASVYLKESLDSLTASQRSDNRRIQLARERVAQLDLNR